MKPKLKQMSLAQQDDKPIARFRDNMSQLQEKQPDLHQKRCNGRINLY